MSISSSIDDLSTTFSGSSMLTTIPCTSIAEPTPQTKGRSYGHVLPGWVPDLGGDRRLQTFSSPQTTGFNTSPTLTATPQRRPTPQPQKTHMAQFRNSSVYMMNYDSSPKPVAAQTIVLPNRIATIQQVNETASMDSKRNPTELKQTSVKPRKAKLEHLPSAAFVKDDPTPAGFAVPTKPSASVTSGTSKKADNHVFSPAIVIHTLKANGVHHATYYKCSYQRAESLECHEKNFAEWVLPNMSPRMPVLHWCVQTGAVTTLNLRTGASADEELLEPPQLRKRSRSQLSRWNGVGDLSNPVLYDRESGISEVEDSPAVTQIYRTEDELEYQRQIMRDFAPTLEIQTSESTTSQSISDESTLREESSSMDFMGGHDLPYLPPTNSKYAADYWLSLMTDNHPGQRMAAGRDCGVVASDSTSTASSFCPKLMSKQLEHDVPADSETVMNEVVDLCDYLLSTLTTTAPKPPSTYSPSMPLVDEDDPTPVAASTSGTITSFPIYVKRDPR